MPFALSDLLADPPRLHDDNGKIVSWGMEAPTLEYIAKMADTGVRSLEVGVGGSTLLLGSNQCRHVAVTPFQTEADRLTDYARRRGIPLDTVRIIIGRSQDVLPALPGSHLDFAIIDGDHAFPMPIVDWMYISDRLSNGGVILFDDAQIWTGDIMRRFLREDPGWKLEWAEGRSFAFRKITTDPSVRPWSTQPFVVRRSLAWRNDTWVPAGIPSEGPISFPSLEHREWRRRYGRPDSVT